MPKIINTYTDDSLAKAFANMGESFVSNTPALELARQKAYGLSRDNQSYQVLQDAERAGGYDPNDPSVRAAIVGLDKPKEFYEAQRGLAATRYGAADPRATNAYVGAGGAYSGTAQGTRESEANRVAIENLRTQRGYDAAIHTAELQPQQAIDENGRMIITSRKDAIDRKLMPIVGHSELQADILRRAMPSLTPDQAAAAGGYAPKNPGNLWTYQTPDGKQGTTADGRSDVSSGAALPAGTKTIKLEGPNTEGLTSDNATNRKLVDSEVAMKQSSAMIDNLIADLSKPNAAQNVGYVGSIANTLNGWRAQAEAASKAIGGLSADQAVADPGVQQSINEVMGRLNPALVSRLQQMGIDSAIVKSQIHNLAYVIARSQDPSGRISKDDVLRAGETIGASLQDPVAGVRVLTALKSQIQQNWKIQDETIRQRYKVAPGGNAAAPSAPAPAAQGNVVDWQTYFGAPQ